MAHLELRQEEHMRLGQMAEKNPLRITRTICLAIALILLLTTTAVAQQTYISKYDAFIGYTNLNSPKIDLSSNGLHFQGGMRWRTWMSLGFDYSWSKGDMLLTPDLLPKELQTRLAAMLGQLAAAGKLPPGYALQVGANAKTQTFAAGPQFSYHRWKAVTPFIRPSLGAIYEEADPTPGDPIAKAVVMQLAPSGKKTDWQGFYGMGGGFDLNVHKHLALRIQADWVYDHLFNDILADGRQTVRFSIGPAFNFGPNIVR
jgi:hypothetical protein